MTTPEPDTVNDPNGIDPADVDPDTDVTLPRPAGDPEAGPQDEATDA